jgi:hypothetical protein
MGSIHDIFRAREQFQIVPYDANKIRAYIDFLGTNHQDVKDFNHAEESIKDIMTNSDRLRCGKSFMNNIPGHTKFLNLIGWGKCCMVEFKIELI